MRLQLLLFSLLVGFCVGLRVPRLRREETKRTACKPRIISAVRGDPSWDQALSELALQDWVLKKTVGDREFLEEYFHEYPILGGSLVISRNTDGEPESVFGKSYSHCNLVVLLNPVITLEEGKELVSGYSRDPVRGINTPRKVEISAMLVLDPIIAKLLVIVDVKGIDAWWNFWVDTAEGYEVAEDRIINAMDRIGLLTSKQGRGYYGEVRDLSELSTESRSSGHYFMLSSNKRLRTMDSTYSGKKGKVAESADGIWSSKYESLMVDIQYYVDQVDKFLQDRLNYNWLDYYPKGIISVAHYSKRYVNSFWNGEYIVFGNGNPLKKVDPMGSDPDVVAHEIGHGIVGSTSDLLNQDFAGAIGDSFADILAMAFEFETSGKISWIVAEKSYHGWGGIRSLANPKDYRQPSHTDDLSYIGSSVDNGGVHYNSGIINHWYYLLVEGGRNARGSGDDTVVVNGVGMPTAMKLAFDMITSLPQDADFCDLRKATLVYGKAEVLDQAIAAWNAVGVTKSFCSLECADSCRGLCEEGMSCTVHNNEAYCLNCSAFQRVKWNGEVTACCTIDPDLGGCSYSTEARCKVQKGNIVATNLVAPTFLSKSGKLCNKINEFKANRAACVIQETSAGYICDYNSVEKSALEEYEKKQKRQERKKLKLAQG